MRCATGKTCRSAANSSQWEIVLIVAEQEPVPLDGSHSLQNGRSRFTLTGGCCSDAAVTGKSDSYIEQNAQIQLLQSGRLMETGS
jgi:hypothetical protein